LTTDSAASESSPTEPVSAHAVVLSVIVAIAAATESHGSRAQRRTSRRGDRHCLVAVAADGLPALPREAQDQRGDGQPDERVRDRRPEV
jgi:hypothetical protein